MKYADIIRLFEDGLITAEQRDRIQQHYGLKESASKLILIFSMIGAVLVAGGIVLLIASNWETIPRLAKVGSGIALMLGAHVGGYYLREVRKDYLKQAETLHFLGSAMFLANIALVGQVYHLSSRPPNGVLLWWLGIAALPWLLRSTAQHVLSLVAFLLWIGYETTYSGSWLHFSDDRNIVVFWALLGLAVYGYGTLLAGTSCPGFGPMTQILGLLLLNGMSLPLIFKWYYSYHWWQDPLPGTAQFLLAGLLLIGLGLCAVGLRSQLGSEKRWYRVWLGSLAILSLMMVGSLWLAPLMEAQEQYGYSYSYYWIIASVSLFVFALIQIQVGLVVRRTAFVNLAVFMVAILVVSTYVMLFGSMARTGMVFVFGGVLLIALGVYLEKKRRSLLAAMKTAAEGKNAHED